ncbi:CD59 glycoprotein-like [Acipenser ruthenus]|uniref:CD59 glycoprotein-like n=1 Tax=Acipenser ruthenus TaxID=7906 RepID=UPI0027424B35|nr:CD59 glycoprotein-like [Acipenser ruthenus]XP_058859224.1 CD59 glycoprotein-like [Acipenser ruthenus]
MYGSKDYLSRMKNVVICIVLCVSFFSVGFALQCYSCQESVASCMQTCGNMEDSCLKLSDKGGNVLRQQCIRYVDCDFSRLNQLFPGYSNFRFHCCNTNLCNSGTVTAMSKSLLSLITVLTVFWMYLM